MGILHVAGEDARHELPGRRYVVRGLPDEELVLTHLHQDFPYKLLDIYFLLKWKGATGASKPGAPQRVPSGGERDGGIVTRKRCEVGQGKAVKRSEEVKAGYREKTDR